MCRFMRYSFLLRRSYSISLNTIMDVVATTSKVFELSNLSGMTKLDRSRFVKKIDFPIIRIPTMMVGRIIGLKSIRNSTVPNRGSLKPIMNGETKEEKIVVFDPDALIKVGEEQVLADIANVGSKMGNENLRFETLHRELNYNDLDVKTCIRAVLPPALDFSGYAQVGHIAHLNLRDELLPYKFTIAEILHDKIAWAKTVVNKLNAINNDFRFFDMELLAGEPEYITTVIEQGIKYRLDFSKVFWNSRLTNVHDLIIRKFNAGSVVFDVFAGVGPFVIPAVKLKGARKCFANDLNPSSVEYLCENVKLNKLPENRIETFNMDGADFIREVISAKIAEFYALDASQSAVDMKQKSEIIFHTVMNLPCLAVEFLKHFHGFLATRPELRLKVYEINMLKKIFEHKIYSPSFSEFFDTTPFMVHCHLFVKAKQERPRQWFQERAVEMVRDRLRLPDLDIKEVYYIRTVSTNKEMFCVAFRLPTDYAFDTAQWGNEVKATDAESLTNGLLNDGFPPAKREANISIVADENDFAKEPKIRRL